jgi:hypothetical protein
MNLAIQPQASACKTFVARPTSSDDVEKSGKTTAQDYAVAKTNRNTGDCPSLSPTDSTATDNPVHHDREWWATESRRQGTDWGSLGQAAIAVVVGLMQRVDDELGRHSFEIGVERLAKEKLAKQNKVAKPQPRPTPQVTIEAIMLAVRERGIDALKEPAIQDRLQSCDERAREQINRLVLQEYGGHPHDGLCGASSWRGGRR